jgi:hypothetical protein
MRSRGAVLQLVAGLWFDGMVGYETLEPGGIEENTPADPDMRDGALSKVFANLAGRYSEEVRSLIDVH